MQDRENFLASYFPCPGTFYLDEACLHPVFVGLLEFAENNVRIKILEKNNDWWGGGFNLYAHLKLQNFSDIVSLTFLNCDFSRDLDKEYVYFETFMMNNNHNGKGYERNESKISLPEFLSENNKFKKMFITIKGLDNWLWSHNSFEDKFLIHGMDKNGNLTCGINKRANDEWLRFNSEYKYIAIPAFALQKKLLFEAGVNIIFHSNPDAFGQYPNFKIWQDSFIEIVAREKEKAIFFFRIIYKLLLYFTAISSTKCLLHEIYYAEPMRLLKSGNIKQGRRIIFYHNSLPWDFTCSEYVKWNSHYNLRYQRIQKELEASLNLFSQKFKDLYPLIQFLADIDNKYEGNYFEIYISQQIQILEMYGNIKLKGEYETDKKGKILRSQNYQDIKKVLELIPDSVFDKIFVHVTPDNNTYAWNIFGEKNKDKDLDELKEILLLVLTELRNLIIHPYRDGCMKEIKNTKIPEDYFHDNQLHMSMMSALSAGLNRLLRWLLYKEIGLDKYY